MRDEHFTATALRICAGVIIWAAHFTVIYGYTGLACARRDTAAAETWLEAVPWVIAIASVAAAALTLLFIAPALRGRGSNDFTVWMSGGVAALALVGIVYEALAVLWIPLCTGLR